MFWVPFLPHGSNTLACREGGRERQLAIDQEGHIIIPTHQDEYLTCHRFLTGGTESASRGVIVDLAVWLPLVVKIVASRECYPTHLKGEKKWEGQS